MHYIVRMCDVIKTHMFASFNFFFEFTNQTTCWYKNNSIYFFLNFTLTLFTDWLNSLEPHIIIIFYFSYIHVTICWCIHYYYYVPCFMCTIKKVRMISTKVNVYAALIRKLKRRLIQFKNNFLLTLLFRSL